MMQVQRGQQGMMAQLRQAKQDMQQHDSKGSDITPYIISSVHQVLEDSRCFQTIYILATVH